jgi:cellulose synthase (UDP-forming)
MARCACLRLCLGPSHGDLEAAASISSWMGSLASYRGFTFKPMIGRLPAGNAIVFMKTPAFGLAVPINGATATMVRNPADPSGMLLVIAGRNDAEPPCRRRSGQRQGHSERRIDEL